MQRLAIHHLVGQIQNVVSETVLALVIVTLAMKEMHTMLNAVVDVNVKQMMIATIN